MKEEKKLRAAAYIRVSTDMDEQKKSLELQREYFLRKIKEDESLELAGIYEDAGCSGLSVRGRPEFMRLMEDCRKGTVDVIMTKSISRFARNISQCIGAVHELRALGVAVMFDREGLRTMEPGRGDEAGRIGQEVRKSFEPSELVLAVMSIIAQEESGNISRAIKWSNEAANSKGLPTRPAGYGYRREGLVWRIEPKEAKRVRTAFELAGSGEFTYKDIRERLDEMEKRDSTGRCWNQQRLRRLLRNEIYVGDVLTNKYYVPDMLSGRQVKNRGERHQYYVAQHHPPLVSRESFCRVQGMMASGNLKSIGGRI